MWKVRFVICGDTGNLSYDWEIYKVVEWPFPWLPREGEEVQVEPEQDFHEYTATGMIWHLLKEGYSVVYLTSGLLDPVAELVERFGWQFNGDFQKKEFDKHRRHLKRKN